LGLSLGSHSEAPSPESSQPSSPTVLVKLTCFALHSYHSPFHPKWNPHWAFHLNLVVENVNCFLDFVVCWKIIVLLFWTCSLWCCLDSCFQPDFLIILARLNDEFGRYCRKVIRG
jgi:hypothetical protein